MALLSMRKKVHSVSSAAPVIGKLFSWFTWTTVARALYVWRCVQWAWKRTDSFVWSLQVDTSTHKHTTYGKEEINKDFTSCGLIAFFSCNIVIFSRHTNQLVSCRCLFSAGVVFSFFHSMLIFSFLCRSISMSLLLLFFFHLRDVSPA